MSKLVSVVIPVYNGEPFIEETIRSVLSQSYADWELLIVDDGSTDRTAELCKAFTSDKRVRYLRQSNAGVSAARNYGLKEAKGEYIAFLDADDLWLSENLVLKAKYLEAYPEVALVHSDVEYIDERSRKLGYVNKGKEGYLLDDLLLWNGTCVNCPSSILVRKSVAEAVEGFDPQFSTAADQDFYFRLAKNNKIGNIAEATVLYRVHGSNMSANVALMEKDHLAVYEKAREHNLFKSNSFRRKCYSDLYLILAGSWWVNGKNKMKGLRYMWLAFISYPPNAGKILKKIVK